MTRLLSWRSDASTFISLQSSCMLSKAEAREAAVAKAQVALPRPLPGRPPFLYSPTKPPSCLLGLARGEAPHTHTYTHTPLSGTYWKTRSFSAGLG